LAREIEFNQRKGKIMDAKEKHQQKKDKEREEQKKIDKAYEEESQKNRVPFNPIGWVVGTVLVLLIIYIWTAGMW
jgi:hypothetical protein